MTDPFAAAWTPSQSVAERRAVGREARRRTPRSALATRSSVSRDAGAVLDRQNSDRVPELVPLRAERMAASAFAFYRGAAAVMAGDLAEDPHSGFHVASCGDAHVANFGFFASPQRTLMFDLNDFDEAAWAPWEWDLKRLVTSIVIAGQETSRDEKVVRSTALSAVRTYVRALRSGSHRSALARYYSHFDVATSLDTLDAESRAVMRAAIRDAEKRTGERAVRRMTTRDQRGRLVFLERAPTMTQAEPAIAEGLQRYFTEYAESANVDVGVLVQQYAIADVARRVVGVGSVGTRCYLAVLEDGDENGLLLQAKEASRSVLEEYGHVRQPRRHVQLIAEEGEGARVVALQRILQAVADPFLGHLRNHPADRSFYVRQFHDMKGGLEMQTLDDEPFLRYGQTCAASLARGHGQSATAPAIVGYIGNGKAVGEAILAWAFEYAEINRADHAAFADRLRGSASGSSSPGQH